MRRGKAKIYVIIFLYSCLLRRIMITCMWCYTLTILSLVCGLSNSAKRGELCNVEENGSNGLCKYVTDCESAGKFSHSEKEMSPDICELESTIAVVCCEDENDQPPLVKDTSVKKSDQSILTLVHNIDSDKSPFVPHKTELKQNIPLTHREPGVISKQKCDEYADYAWEVKYPETLSLLSFPTRTLECVFEKTPLVIGGQKAKPTEFPHMALLGYQPRQNGEIQWRCGGSLISENFVLTSAHCLKNRETGPVKFVRLGVTNLTDLTYAKEVEVLDSFENPLYEHEKYHDIALLKIDNSTLQFHPALRPACLYTLQDVPTQRAIATGFGATNTNGDASLYLMKVVLEFFSVHECNETYSSLIQTPGSTLRMGITGNSMVCAGSRTKIEDTCEGDSGGPIQSYHEETETNKCMYDIVGVTSFGSGCGLSKGNPGVYTRVSYYIKWIEDIVWPAE